MTSLEPRQSPVEPPAVAESGDQVVHEISVVVPVYQGERVLGDLVAELAPLTVRSATPGGRAFRIDEVLLVHDCGPDDSARVARELSEHHPWVRPIWLSRNFGQHPATLAGLASTVGRWVATLDEDGQQDPRDIGRLLDSALDHEAQLVYARPTNAAPHGLVRNAGSAFAKWVFVSVLGNRAFGRFNSFRLMDGEVARGVAAFCGESVFLDVALSWVVSTTAQSPVALRAERGRPSGYGYRRLIGHFWQLVLTSGTRPLRYVAVLGLFAVVAAAVLSAYIVYMRLAAKIPVQGWTSLVVVTSLFSGLVLISLGVIAEYLGVAVSMAMGKPPYLIVSRPAGQPVAREARSRSGGG